LPLDHLAGAPLGVSLAAGLLALTTMAVFQVRAIIRAPYPGIRAIEALAATAPLFLLQFAATYVLMAWAEPSNFNVPALTRPGFAVLHGHRVRHRRLRRHHRHKPT
jgi:voltage-gated potassium channel